MFAGKRRAYGRAGAKLSRKAMAEKDNRQDDRAERLAAALRANLKRRKDQARATSGEPRNRPRD